SSAAGVSYFGMRYRLDRCDIMTQQENAQRKRTRSVSAIARNVKRSAQQSRQEFEMAVKKGWTGRVFEDFEVGDVYEHPLGRTILAADNTWFTLLTMNTNPIHFDANYTSKTEFGKPLVNSCLTLAIVTGQSVIDLSQNVMANLGWDEIRLP